MPVTKTLTTREKEFLLKLAKLCDEYKAGFSDVTQENGIHITVDEEKIFFDFIDNNLGETIRGAIEESKD